MFTVKSKLQGTTNLLGKIYLWNCTDKIVVSDVDGTITKSDKRGHLLTNLGLDWSHDSVCLLMERISAQGYKILYLTARAISQSSLTREYLRDLRQGESRLPEGPVLMSEDELIDAFTREVIAKKPQEFKIPCLR
jgi:phosphatidate phosphatase LPIN